MVAENQHRQLITAIDHIVIGARDLSEATEHYARQGFTVMAGGRHIGRGTQNNLIPLRNTYLELISVYDEADAEGAGRGELVNALRTRPSDAPVAYALQTNDLEAVATALTDEGIEIVGPFRMRRSGTVGHEVGWRLIVPYGNQYRTWWPFFIEWDTAADWPRDEHAHHDNGSQEMRDIVVAAEDLGAVRTMFENALGLSPIEVTATRIGYAVADTRIVIAKASGSDELAHAVAGYGAGVLRIGLDSGSALGVDIG